MKIKWTLLERVSAREWLDLNSLHALWKNFLIYFPQTVMLYQLVYQFSYESAKTGERGGKKACIFFLFCITNRHFVFVGNIGHLSSFPLRNYKHILRTSLWNVWFSFHWKGKLNVVSKMLGLRLEISVHPLAVPGRPLLYTSLFCLSNRKEECVALGWLRRCLPVSVVTGFPVMDADLWLCVSVPTECLRCIHLAP